MKTRTYQQIFEARIVLCGALHYIAQEHCGYHEGSLRFETTEGLHAFLIVHNLLTELEAEFRAKKKRRAA